MTQHRILWVLVVALAAAPFAASARPHPRQVHRQAYAHARSIRPTAARRGARDQLARASTVNDHAYHVTPDLAPTGVDFQMAPEVVGSFGLHHRPQVRPLAPEPISGPEYSRFDKPDSAFGISISHPF